MSVRPPTPREAAVLVAAIFTAGLCSIVYELLIATTSSYFLGDSVKQFSITIGLFMASMGLGSFLSRATGEAVLSQFVAVEVALGVLGGVSVPALYLCYAYTDLYVPAMVAFTVAVGALTGLEVPLLARVMQHHYPLKVNLSTVLSLDYLGALAATLLFPFALLPFLGTFRSSLVVGLVNLVVAGLFLRTFAGGIGARARRASRLTMGVAGVALALAFALAGRILAPWHDAVYEDRVVLAKQTPYQRIVVTRGKGDVRLFLNGNLQFSSIDEYRYHEALVHPALEAAPRRASVLLLGGGDGLAVREVLKHPDVERVTLVDLDGEVTRLATEHPLLRQLNGDALRDPRVTVVNADALRWLVDHPERRHDVIIADLPDPNDASVARLYSREFYRLVGRRLARGGVLVTQATSPFYARRTFWCIVETLGRAGFRTLPYHVNVPSFGDWGFVLATRDGEGPAIAPAALRVRVPTRYLDEALLPGLFVFEKDLLPGEPVELSTLDRPRVLSYYLDDWQHWN